MSPVARITSLYKGAFSGISDEIWLQSLVLLVNRCGSMVVPFMSLYLTQYLGYSLSKAGIVLICFGLGAVSGAFLGGWLTDKIGFRKVQLITLTGGGILFMILSGLEDYYSICIFTFLLSTINEAFRPANASAIAFYTTIEDRTRSYTLARLATNTGWVIGGALGGILASINYKYLFWVDGITNIAAVFIIKYLLSPVDVGPKKLKNRQILNLSNSAYADWRYLAFIILTCLFGIIFFQIFSSLTMFYKTEKHLSELFIGILMALNGIIVVTTEMVLIYSLDGKKHKLSFISVGTLLLSLSFVIFNFFQVDEKLAIIAMILFTLGEMLAMPFMNAQWVAMSKEENRGQYAGLYTMAWSVAHILAPAIGTFTADHFGFAILWWCMGLLGLLASIGFYMLKNYTLKNIS